MHLLVEWINEKPKSWSVVSREQLSDGTQRKSQNLVDRTVGVLWKKRVHQAVVIDANVDATVLETKADKLADEERKAEKLLTGSNRKRNSKGNSCGSKTPGVDQLASSSKSQDTDNILSAKKSRAEEIQSVLNSAGECDATNGTSSPEQSDVPNDVADETEDWKKKYMATKEKLRNLRKKYESLKADHARCADDDQYDDIESLDLKLTRSEIYSALKTMSPSITFFVRNLFRRAFKPEEIIGHSLLGRKSTADKNHIPLPEVDPQRRDAIIALCLKTYGLEIEQGSSSKLVGKRKAAKTKIIKSLSDYFREENSKAVKNQQ